VDSSSPVTPGDVVLKKYRVERLLGIGAMGIVAEATHLALDQRVAIKFMLPGKDAGGEQYARFIREARASVRLTSPHVTRVFDVGALDSGAPYMVMELLHGRDLDAVLKQRGPLPFAEAAELILQACEALAEAHAIGIVHRDVKPSNLFLTKAKDGTPCVKVIDFGISKSTTESLKLTQKEEILGSPSYMSPEQMRSSDVDARSDVWALGATLYELVAGAPPFSAHGIQELCAKVWFEPPTPLVTYRPDAPPAFAQVLAQCLEKDRERRWPSVAAFAAALAPHAPPRAAVYVGRVAFALGEQAEPARPTIELTPPPGARSGSVFSLGSTARAVVAPVGATRPRRGTAAAILGIAMGVLFLGAAGVVGWQIHREPVPAASASSVPGAAASSASLPPAPPRDAPAAMVTSIPAPDAGAPVEPSAKPSVSAATPSAPRAPKSKPPSPGPTPAPQAPAPRPKSTTYDQ
jgi:eukaryotic-like serine/threonine-protein kinase